MTTYLGSELAERLRQAAAARLGRWRPQAPFDPELLKTYAELVELATGLPPGLLVGTVGSRTGFAWDYADGTGRVGVAALRPKETPGVNCCDPREALPYLASRLAFYLALGLNPEEAVEAVYARG